MNEQIRLSPVRLIDETGAQRGIVPTDDALRLAQEAGMDLVEVSPNERPPVCKIMDYGKHKYLQSKKQKQKHHEQRLKEVRIRPKTDAHDRAIKLGKARSFLEHGDKVQFTMMFRGRERFHREMGLEAFDKLVEELSDLAKLERPARTMGRRMTMVLVPLKSPVSSKPKSPSPGPKPVSGRTAAESVDKSGEEPPAEAQTEAPAEAGASATPASVDAGK